MINDADQLKLQAYLDGELTDQEAAEAASWLAGNAEAREMLGELQFTSAALTGHEAGVRHPESHDFFWSKIRREIERQEQPVAVTPEKSWVGWVFRRFAPVGVLAALAISLVMLFAHSGQAQAKEYGEMELASQDMEANTYRDQEQQMTMIWFSERADTHDSQPEPSASIQP